MREGNLFWNMENFGDQKRFEQNCFSTFEVRLGHWLPGDMERDWEKSKERSVEKSQRQILPIAKFKRAYALFV